MKRNVKAAADSARKDMQALISLRRFERELRDSVPRVAPPNEEPQPIVVHQGVGTFALVLTRLEQIETALLSKTPIDEELREELLAIVAIVARDAAARKRKRSPRIRALFLFASTVAVLRALHRIPLKAALWAVLPDTLTGEKRIKMEQNVQKAQRDLSALSKTGMRIIASESQVKRALARLRNTPIRK